MHDASRKASAADGGGGSGSSSGVVVVGGLVCRKCEEGGARTSGLASGSGLGYGAGAEAGAQRDRPLRKDAPQRLERVSARPKSSVATSFRCGCPTWGPDSPGSTQTTDQPWGGVRFRGQGVGGAELAPRELAHRKGRRELPSAVVAPRGARDAIADAEIGRARGKRRRRGGRAVRRRHPIDACLQHAQRSDVSGAPCTGRGALCDRLWRVHPPCRSGSRRHPTHTARPAEGSARCSCQSSRCSRSTRGRRPPPVCRRTSGRRAKRRCHAPRHAPRSTRARPRARCPLQCSAAAAAAPPPPPPRRRAPT